MWLVQLHPELDKAHCIEVSLMHDTLEQIFQDRYDEVEAMEAFAADLQLEEAERARTSSKVARLE